MSFAAILAEGKARRQAALAEEAHQRRLDEAFAAHRVRQQAKRDVRTADGWDEAMADLVPGASDAAPDGAGDAEQRDEPRQQRLIPPPPPRRRRGGHYSSMFGSTAPAQTAVERGWDRALQAAVSDTPARSAAPRAGTLLSRLWRSMFPTD